MRDKILIVDDDREIRDVLRILLTGEGFEVAEAAGGETGCSDLLLPGGGDLDPALYGQAPQGCDPPDPERDRREISLCRKFLAEGKPILGICRGAQVIAAALELCGREL